MYVCIKLTHMSYIFHSIVRLKKQLGVQALTPYVLTGIFEAPFVLIANLCP
jgi:hypothetical protein